MSDIKKINENDTNNSSSFIDKTKKEYEELSNMLESLKIDEDNIKYSTDINKFNSDCLEFIEYIKTCINDDSFHILYMLRRKNIITYGEYGNGRKIDKNTIEMISNEDLKKLYELLQNEFSSNFVDGWKHTFGKGWSLNPTIGENIIMDINSDIYSDSSWFYAESHKEQQSELPNKR